MSNKVKIYSDLKSGKVHFDGSRVSDKEIGSLEVLAHPTLTNRVIIKSNTVFKRSSDTEFRVFFGKLNINRVLNKDGEQLTLAPYNYDRSQIISYIEQQITKPIITEYFEYDPVLDRLVAQRDIQVDKSGFFLGEKHKMASGNSTIYFEDLDNKANSYPVFGEVLDQSLSMNQQAGAGATKPKSRIFGDFQSISLGGSPVDDTSIPYDGSNFFPFNISGVGITTRIAEVIPADQQLKYEITVNGISVYVQYLEHTGLAINEDLTWYFEHPLDIESGTTLRATIYKVSVVDNQETIEGILNVCEGDDIATRYQTNVLNRFFEDEEIALKSDVNQLLSGSTYKGAYDALADSPSLPTGTDVLGDFYRVSVAGNGASIGDIKVFNGTTYDLISEQNATQSDIKNSGLKVHDIYVKAGYAGAVQDGSVLYPYADLTTAIGSTNDGDSLYLEGSFEISGEIILPQSKSLYFYGSDDACVSFTNYSDGNGSLFYFNGLDNTKELKFTNISFKNAGGYGLYIKKAAKVTVEDCEFKNNGWNGTSLNTVLPSTTTALLGYDSSAADLQAFYASSNASNGGAMRIEEATQLLIIGNTATNNLRGIRVQDCGINGGGVISRNQSTQNIESGIYIAAGSLGGCHNITSTMNVSSYNANNGLLVIGGINNKFSQNEVNGNWNAGFCAWGSANATLRDCGLYDNNRSEFNGIGNTGDAKASIQINEAYDYLGTIISANSDFRFIAEILDTQVHYTGLGSNTNKIGLLITSEVGDLDANDSNIIKIDDVGFIGQDYAIDFSEVDLSNLHVAIGDNSFMSVGEKAVRTPLGGDYFELPFSNHTTKINYADISVDLTGNVIIREGVGGNKLNPYKVNDLQAVASGTEIKVILKDSDKVQFIVPVSGCSIDGSFVNSVLNQAVIQLNNAFTNTAGFASDDTFVNSFTLSGNNLTLGLNDGVSYTVDVTTLGVDENNFVSSGSLSGSDLTLTMADATTVVIDASSLAIDTNDVVTSGTLNGDDLELTLSNSSVITIDVSALAVDTTLYVESGVLSGTDLVLTMSDASTVTIDASSLAIDTNTTITGGEVSGTDILLDVSDGSTLTIDASTLGGSGSSGNPVVSGSVVGTDLVLVLDDATTVTIDASNMINGSSGLASSNGWFISYGTNANDPVGTSINDSTINQQLPFYFGEALEQGSEFKWNFQSNGGANLIMGIWDGAESPLAYNGGASTASNWGTSFTYAGGFTAGSNSTLLTTNSGAKYVVSNGDAMGIRFGNDGHLTLIDYSGTNEVAVAKTTIALSVTSFNMQMYTWANGVLPNGIINNVDYIWDIVHDFANTEAGIINGILDHTVLKSAISIEKGEKLMFMLDEVGQGDYFGTNYTAASSGVATAEEQLDNEFSYATNEALSFEFGGTSDWNINTNATYYFDNGAGVVGYRKGGANTIQGMFSMRFNDDGKLTIYSEDNGEKVATAKADPTIGSSVHFYYGVRGNRAYYSIPVISKQSINGGSQPNVDFVPTVANQTASVEEGDVLNFQIISSDNIVNQFAEVDAPSWMYMNQNTGVLSGTAPSYLGTSADVIVVNCKAGNAIGGTVDFTVTVSVTEIAYTNSKSLSLDGSTEWLQGNPANVTALERASNGDGNAWTISMWVKPNSSTATQTLMVYGAGDDYNGGAITLKQSGGTSLVFNYGTVYNNIILVAANSFVANTWQHVMITFDGGTTGSVPADSSDYYSRFDIYIDGVLKSNIGVASNSGYDGAISGANPSDNIYRIGRASNVHNNYYGGIINQVAIWGTDETANLATIYNSGAVQDLSQLASAPAHYYEIESSVTTISDLIGSADLTGYNFATGDLVTDTP